MFSKSIRLSLQKLQEVHGHRFHDQRCGPSRCKLAWMTRNLHISNSTAAQSVKITKGDELVKTYHDAAQDSGNAIPRHFCSECGSPLFNTNGDFGKTTAVFYSALDDFNVPGDAEKKPEVEYYAKDRSSWVHPLEGTLQPSTKPGRD